MSNNNSVKLNYHPINPALAGAAVVLLLVSILFKPFLKIAGGSGETNIALFCVLILVVCVVPALLTGFVVSRLTVRIGVGPDRLKIKGPMSTREILFSDIKDVSWSGYKESNGLGKASERITLDITLTGSKGKISVNDGISSDQLEKYLNGQVYDLPILQIYSILAEKMPERASGGR